MTEDDSAEAKKRIERLSEPDLNSGCRLWAGGATRTGYGTMKWKYKAVGAHRLSYEAEHGAFDKGLHVLHKCDTPLCVNPDHLRLGTHKENMRDMGLKGRRKSIPKEQKRPISQEVQEEAIRLLRTGMGTGRVGLAVGISQHSALRIKNSIGLS